MCCSAWLNRGKLLGIGIGLLMGSGAAWVWSRAQPKPVSEETTCEAPKPEPSRQTVPTLETAPPPHVKSDGTRSLTKAERAALIRRYEWLAESLRLEIESIEKNISLIERANRTADENGGRNIQALQKRYTESDGEYNRLSRELAHLEAERNIFKAKLEKKDPTSEPDPVAVEKALSHDERVVKAKAALNGVQDMLVRELDLGGHADGATILELKAEVAKARTANDAARREVSAEAVKVARMTEQTDNEERLNNLVLSIELNNAERESVRLNRDAFRKLIDNAVGGGPNVEELRLALKPQRETLEKLNKEIARLKLEQ